MKAIAEHIRHRFSFGKSSAQQSVTCDPTQPELADFLDCDFAGPK